MDHVSVAMGESNKPLREIIYNKLVEDIVQGRINAGEKLLESELAKRFHVSRTPVREVLVGLEEKGYITLTKNVGAVVIKVSARKMQEIYDVVAQLEGYATRIVSTDKLGEKVISYLQTLQNQMEDSINKREYTRYVQKNTEFHEFFVKKCGNETLQQIVSDLRKRIYRLVTEGLTLPMHIDEYLASHREIIDAISARNPLKAEKLMKSHVEDAKRFLLSVMKDLPK